MNDTMYRIRKYAERGRAICTRALAEGRGLTPDEQHTIDGFINRMNELKRQARGERPAGEQLAELDAMAPAEPDLYLAAKAAGWEPGGRVVVPFAAAAKTLTVTGELEDLEPIRTRGPALGADRRHLYPVFPAQEVEGDATAVQTMRQSARTLADPEDMIRELDATTRKPEVGSQIELVQAGLRQVAAIQSGVPNILAVQDGFRDFINTDLRLAYAEAIDAMVRTAIEDAAPQAADAGANLLEGAVNAVLAIQGEGYAPDVIAMSPEDAADFALLQTQGPEGFYVKPSFADVGLTLQPRIVKGLAEPLVLDSTAAGRLYSSPAAMASFEEADSDGHVGATNSQLFRLESNAVFVVQRVSAIARIAAGS